MYLTPQILLFLFMSVLGHAASLTNKQAVAVSVPVQCIAKVDTIAGHCAQHSWDLA